jgi:Tol biopolymer transport system component
MHRPPAVSQPGCIVSLSISFGLGVLAFVQSASTLAPPEIFSPGVISGPAKEDSLVFTPDGNTAYFDRAQWPNALILESHRSPHGWSTPRIAPFSGEWLDHDPAMAPDGSFLVFASNRPAQTGGAIVREGGNLWRVDRKGNGWSAPVRLPDAINASPKTYAPCIAGDGSLYYQQADADTGEFHLLRAQYRDGHYETPVRVTFAAATIHELDPAVAPDESFIVFDANDPAHLDRDRLFIAFRAAGQWGVPVDLGDAVNAHGAPWGAHLGPDHRTLYFSSTRTTPVQWPRTRADGERDLARLQSWDNGNENIWQVSLAPLIDAHAHASM